MREQPGVVKSLKVIVVTPEVPDPFGNAAARWYYALAKGLSERGHQVQYFSACSPATGGVSLERARDQFFHLNVPLRLYPYPMNSWFQRKWNTLKRPYSYFISSALRTDLAHALSAGYDILNLEQMWAGYLGVGVERALLSVHHLELLDLAGAGSASIKSFLARSLMFRAERSILAGSPTIRVTTSRLSREVSRLNPKARVFTVPVAIDPDLYPFSSGGRDSKTVGLIASFGWTPGYEAGVRLLTRIWPKLKKAVPEAELLIVGWNARRALAKFIQGPSVTVLENVPDAARYFHKLTALLYPLVRGSGMKLKLLEAMAYGTPIVTTAEGAEGITIVDGHHALLADEDDLFVEKTKRLLLDTHLANELRSAGRALVEQEYSPGPVVTQMERVYQAVMLGDAC